MTADFWMMQGVMILSWIILVFCTAAVPYYGRKNTAFGISVPESQYRNPFFVQLRRQFLWLSVGTGVLLGALSMGSALWTSVEVSVWLQLAGIVLYLVAVTLFYFRYHGLVKAFKNQQAWKTERVASALLTSGTGGKRPMSAWWFLTYLAVIVATWLIPVIQYPHLPDQIPMHYNFAGEVDRYASKSMAVFSSMPLLQILMAVLFVAIFLFALRAKAQSGGGRLEHGLLRDQRYRALMAAFLFWIGLATEVLFLLLQLSMLMLIPMWAVVVTPLVFLALVCIPMVILMIRVGQSGSRLAGETPEPASDSVEADDHWKGGFFYVNRADPSLLVEKRFGLGFTLNFGNPKAIGILVGLLVITVAICLVPMWLT